MPDPAAVSLFEQGLKDDKKQESHTLQTALLLEQSLKACLEGLMRALFGQGKLSVVGCDLEAVD